MRTRGWARLGIVAGTFAGALIAPREASAITAWTTDCFGVQDKDVFNPGDPVCVTGELDIIPPGEFVCAAGYVHVVPFQNADPWFDVTAGNANYILGCAGAGAFFDEYVWLPPLLPGTYEITIDQYPFQSIQTPQGMMGPEDYRTNVSFTVLDVEPVFSVDVAAIKAAAQDGLEYAYAIADLADLLKAISMLNGVADFAVSPNIVTGLLMLHGIMCYEPPCPQPEAEDLCDIPGFINKCDWTIDLDDPACPPTSYNGMVIGVGTTIMDGISNALAKHYVSLICDPPDPDFDVVAALDMKTTLGDGIPSFAPGAAHPIPAGLSAINQALAVQATAYQALLPTLEKLQGAEIAGSNTGLMVQAEKTIAYAELARAAGAEMLEAVDVMEAELAMNDALDETVDVAALAASLDGGLTDEQLTYFKSFDIPDATVDAALEELTGQEQPTAVSRAALLAAVRGTYESMDMALENLSAQAEAVRAENAPYALRLGPKAAISGATEGGVGMSTTLTASAQHIDANATITYAWDTDLDGAFDDGAGASMDFIPAAPGLAIAAVRATDDQGRSDVSMHSVRALATNAPPVIDAASPSEGAPFADVGETVTFDVTASDPDGDAVSVQWLVDGEVVATVDSFDFVMPDEQMHVVTVVVSDTDPYTADARARFTVRASKWEGQTGEGGSGGQGSGAGSPTGAGGDGGNGGGDGAESGGDGCDCSTRSSGAGNGLAALVALGLLFGRRRRREG